jgi:hypothetical protein
MSLVHIRLNQVFSNEETISYRVETPDFSDNKSWENLGILRIFKASVAWMEHPGFEATGLYSWMFHPGYPCFPVATLAEDMASGGVRFATKRAGASSLDAAIIAFGSEGVSAMLGKGMLESSVSEKTLWQTPEKALAGMSK